MGEKASPTSDPPKAAVTPGPGEPVDPGAPTPPASPAATPTPPPAAAPLESAFPPTLRKRGAMSLEDTVPLWESFRLGKVAICPTDGGSLALSVDGASAYRLVCTQCGTASAWFEAPPTGIRSRTTPPPPDDRDDD
jgi:hypothetical protein